MSSSSQSGSKPTGTHVNPDPSPEVAAIPTDKATRQRGPVEEVIFKRMKQLGKKLQRYRAYAAQDVNSLNADQRAALVALPALEGAYKELEDLVREKGPVEEQELIQSAKLREATDAARAAALAEAGSSTEQYKSSLAKPLSLFLRLHTLLHPARASDHEHLTFAPLDLPDNLSDEVQATDVIRVGRLYEDLLTGGEAAQGVLDVLVSGPNGEDEENDHVHYLLDLLSQPAPAPSQVVESATDTPAEPATDADFTAAALAESVEAATEATPEAVVSQEEAPMSSANGHATAHQPVKATINFLQEDELEVSASAGAVAPAETAEAAEPADDLKDDPIEQSYEIVPSLEAHQTSGQQPPVEEASATRPSATSRAPSNFAPAPTGSWADLDDEEDFLGAAQTAATQFASAITENATPASDEPTESAAAAEGSSSRDKSSTKAQRGRGRGRGGQSRPRQGGRQPSQSQEQDGQQQERPPRQQRPPRQSREPKQQSQEQSQVAPGGKVVDDDGFEVKARRGPQQPTRGTGGTRSLTRGAPRGGPGGAGRGGNHGRGGRGVAGGTGQRAASGQQEQRKPSQSQGQNGAKSNGSATPAAGGIASTLKPKPSIFKAVQPTGPKSAPIIS